jgi:hypothetical protein
MRMSLAEKIDISRKSGAPAILSHDELEMLGSAMEELTVASALIERARCVKIITDAARFYADQGAIRIAGFLEGMADDMRGQEQSVAAE